MHIGPVGGNAEPAILHASSTTEAKISNAALSNDLFNEARPDFVLVVSLVGAQDTDAASVQQVVKALTGVGVYVQVRQGNPGSALVLVKGSSSAIQKKSLNESMEDWVHEIPSRHTQLNTIDGDDNDTPAERLRMVYRLITEDAAITPRYGEWKFVNSIFAPHDMDLNKQWLRQFLSRWSIHDSELGYIRSQFGEKVAMYFAFLQFYFRWSIGPAVVGVVSHFVLGDYSVLYTLFILLWGVAFVYAWQTRQEQLAVMWGVRGTAQLETARPEYSAKAGTGALNENWNRTLRQFLFGPFALFSCLGLAVFQALVFVIEIFLTQVYDGPGKQYLGFLPTILLAAITPQLLAVYTYYVVRLNKWEDYRTEESYEEAYTLKQFVFNFLVSYTGLFLTAYVYLPFGHRIVPHLDFIRTTLISLSGRHVQISDSFEINAWRLQQQVVYFAVTANVINLAMETIVPYVMNRLSAHAKRLANGELTFSDSNTPEHEYLQDIRCQADLPPYNVQEDYRQIVVMFGYTMLFSPVWSLSPLMSTINLWVQMRGDAAKICYDAQRPIPKRVENIGPWTGALRILTWIGSLTTSSVVAMYSHLPTHASVLAKANKSLVGIHPWTLLVIVLISEHAYFLVRIGVQMLAKAAPAPEVVEARSARFEVRKHFLSEEKFTNATRVPAPVENEWRDISPTELSSQVTESIVPAKTLHDKKNQ
jgi:hypothetical protein